MWRRPPPSRAPALANNPKMPTPRLRRAGMPGAPLCVPSALILSGGPCAKPTILKGRVDGRRAVVSGDDDGMGLGGLIACSGDITATSERCLQEFTLLLQKSAVSLVLLRRPRRLPPSFRAARRPTFGDEGRSSCTTAGTRYEATCSGVTGGWLGILEAQGERRDS